MIILMIIVMMMVIIIAILLIIAKALWHLTCVKSCIKCLPYTNSEHVTEFSRYEFECNQH